ncbi:MAG TPA: hypothetical protein DEA08_23415, partial [Planctomycetes bacterium]|nr:hypothetical protein [Planctomycetota bacterium]
EVERAEAAARERADQALRAIEAYGRGYQPPPTRDSDRALARQRLAGPLRPRRERRLSRRQARLELLSFRAAIQRRLAQLDPLRGREEPEPAQPQRRERLQLAIYKVADLLVPAPDHVAPTVGLTMGSGEVSDFSDDNNQPVLEADRLIELIEAELGDESERGSVEFSSNRLVVRKPAADHARIRGLLERLRGARRGQLLVDLRFYRMPRAVFARLAPHAQALRDEDEQALARAVAAKEVTLVGRQRIVARDGQQVVVRQGGSRALVGDLDVNQTGVVPVLNPVVRNVNEGLVLELRGMIDRSRGQVQLDLALTQAKLAGTEVRKLAGVELELPSLALTRTAATLLSPLGRGALGAGSFAAGESEGLIVYARATLSQNRR